MNNLLGVEPRFPLTLTLSRGEREQPLDTALTFESRGAEDRRRFATKLGAFLPLLGERAGVREDNLSFAEKLE